VAKKIAFLTQGKGIDVRAVLHAVLEEEKLEAVVIAHRVDGDWTVSWGGASLTLASLALAAMMIHRGVTNEIGNDDRPD
jgi:hypothetical protein